MLFMLDTSVCVDLLRGRVAEAHLPAASECVLSVISVAELEVGIRRSARPAEQRKAVEAFIGLFEVLPWDVQTTGHYGELRVGLEQRGVAIGPLDMLIAAHALRHGATLVTGNVQEFQRVAGLSCHEWPPVPGNLLHGSGDSWPRRSIMPDDKKKVGKPDRSRVSAGEDYEVRDLAKKYGVTAAQVKAAIAKAGPMRSAVEKHLRSMK